MGQSSQDSPSTNFSNMKMLVVLAFVAFVAAEPEANADAQYLTYGAGAYRPYTTSRAYPYSTYSAYPYTTYGAYPYNTYSTRHFIAKREADAEADPALVYNTFPYTYSNVAPVVSSAVSPVATYNTVAAVAPIVKTVPVSTYKTVASPAASVVKNVANPVSTYHSVAAPVTTYASPLLRAFATTTTHQITNYNNPTQYTAESISAFGPKYIAKNGPVQHVVKREAEGEADPALVYSNVLAPYTTHYTSAVAAPMIYNSVSAQNDVMPVARSNIVAATPLASNGNQAVAATINRYTHSSNVGVCTNVYGFQVPC